MRSAVNADDEEEEASAEMDEICLLESADDEIGVSKVAENGEEASVGTEEEDEEDVDLSLEVAPSFPADDGPEEEWAKSAVAAVPFVDELDKANAVEEEEVEFDGIL